MPEQVPGSGAAPAAAPAPVVTTPSGGDGAAPAAAAPTDGKPVDSQNQAPADAQNKGTEGTDDGTGDFQDDDSEPVVNKRKSAKDFIIQRQQKKLAKLRKQQGEEPQDGNQPPEGEEGEDPENQDGGEDTNGEDDLPGVLEGFRPIVEKHIAAQDAEEVSSFLKENPDFEPYKAKVERWMKHPSRRHLPVSTIFAEVAMDHLLKIGANRGRQADAEAQQTQAGGGGSNRDAGSPINWKTATKEQLEAEKMRVRQNARY